MSQYGMQMPAGQMQRGATMNIYTGLLFAAVLALLSACVYMYMQGKVIGPNGEALAVHKAPESGKFADTVKLGAD
jgi:hypothetical protein